MQESSLLIAALNTACADCGCSGCCPNCPNGRGIYIGIGEGNSYCLDLPEHGRFCPEAWVTHDGGVALEGRFLTMEPDGRRPDGGLVMRESVIQLQAEAELHGQPVKLAAVTAAEAQPVFHLGLADAGPSWDGLELTLKYQQESWLEMSLGPAQSQAAAPDSCSALPSYAVMFRPYGSQQPWMNYCQDTVPADVNQEPRGMHRAFFLPGLKVLGSNAAVSEDSQRVTMACGTGAIATCLRWGFRPWEADGGAGIDSRHLKVFRSCLPAKRAAYFPGLKAYAKEGAYFGIHEVGEPITRSLSCKRATYQQLEQDNFANREAIEAVWTPDGALCLNPEQLRVDDPVLPGGGLPECKAPGLGNALDGGYLVTTPPGSPLVPSAQ